MLEKLFGPKSVKINSHPEWLQPEAPKTKTNSIPDEITEQSNLDELNIELPEIEIPEHLPNWFDITAEALEDLEEETALGNLAAIGKMGTHDPKIIVEYVKQIPIAKLEAIEQHCIKLACEQAKTINAHIMGRNELNSKNLQIEQLRLKKMFYVAKTLTVAGYDNLSRTLIQLESAYNRATQINV